MVECLICNKSLDRLIFLFAKGWICDDCNEKLKSCNCMNLPFCYKDKIQNKVFLPQWSICKENIHNGCSICIECSKFIAMKNIRCSPAKLNYVQLLINHKF